MTFIRDNTDPYTGIRTRENMLPPLPEAEAEQLDEVQRQFEQVQQLIAARPPIIPTQHVIGAFSDAPGAPIIASGGGGRGSGGGGQGGSGGGGSYARVTTRWAGIEYREPLAEQVVRSNPPPLTKPPVEFTLLPGDDLPAPEQIVLLRQLVEDMLHDWRKLNDIYNHTAQSRDWCTDYEERMANYNTQFKALNLVGREEHWYGSQSCWKTIDGSD